jgi:diguanylate cyclase (GGDEF)-like protein
VTAHQRPPVVLIVDDQEWSTRSLESILAPSGFAVMRSYTAHKGLERAVAHLPDLVIFDVDLPDGSGFELCRELRRDPKLGERTPILLSCPERPTRQQRLEAFRAGAWDVIGYPVDAEELVFRLDAYAKAKFESDRMQDDGLIDESTGLYNLKGLQRRADEMSSWAYRERAALACVVFAPVVAAEDGDGTTAPDVIRALSLALREAGRTSDVIGRLGRSEFAVLAPSTDADGAVKLAQRLAEVIRSHATSPAGNAVGLRAGYDAVANARETPATARDLLRHATIALGKSRVNGQDGGAWVHAFEPRTTPS